MRGAPERGDEVHDVIEQQQITFVLDDVAGFVFVARRRDSKSEVGASIRGLELLWALSFAHFVLYNAVNEARARGGSDIDFSADERTAQAVHLLEWAVSRATGMSSVSWPDDLPQPQQVEPVPGSDTHVATELFLCAAAWVLHHELAHHRLGHLDTNIKEEQQERDADQGATTWLLDSAPAEAVLKRALGITLAVLALNILELQSREPEQKGWLRTHPKAAERMVAALEHPAIDENHQALDFAVVALKMHLDYVGAAYDQAPARTLREDLAEFCFAVARAQAQTAG